MSTCGFLTAITVQIPYELVPVCPLCAKPVSATPPLLTISENGQALTSIELNPLADEVHVLTACDVALGPPPQPPNLTGLPCAPLVTHTNGTLVSAASPANPGETLTAWAFGLGQTTPAATTGEPATMGVTLETFNLDFNYQINALPAKPYTGDPDTIPIHPLFSGLAPGYVGLYQVNFTVPAGPLQRIATMPAALRRRGPRRECPSVQPHREYRRPILLRRRWNLRGHPNPRRLTVPLCRFIVQC